MKKEFIEKVEEAIAEIKSDEESSPVLITEKVLSDYGFEKKSDVKLYNAEQQTYFVHELENGFTLIVKEETTGNYSLVIKSNNINGFTYEPLKFVHLLEKILKAAE